MRRFSYAYQFFDYSTVDRICYHKAVSVIYLIMTDTVFTMKIGVEIVVLMYLDFLISTVGYDKVIQMLKQIQSVKEETKNE